jgi:fatty-acyl-CoA synthase
VPTPSEFEVPANRPHFAVWPRRLPRAVIAPETSLWFNLEVAATRFPDRAAYLFFGRALTYRQMRDDAIALAGWLQKAGVEAGDRVAVFMQNCPQFPVALYAILRANAVVVPVNPMNRAEEFKHYISDPGTKVVICSADLAAIVDAANAALPEGERVRAIVATRYVDAMPAGAIAEADAPPAAMDAWLRADPPLPAGCTRWTEALAQRLQPGPHQAKADDLALLPYTSGTTGLPKGLHAHASHADAQRRRRPVELRRRTRAGRPRRRADVPHHRHALQRARLGVLRLDRRPHAALGSRARRPAHLAAPHLALGLHPDDGDRPLRQPQLQELRPVEPAQHQRRRRGDAVRRRRAAAEGVRPDLRRGLRAHRDGAPSHANPPERAKLQCLGIPIFGVDSRVVDPVTFEELPPGEVGEIITRGPMVFTGYWKHPEATEAAFIDFDGRKFFRTGDLGRMDEEGYFFITDRLKRMINASGFKVWPAEVEMLLYKHPAVQEACIIAARDAYRGETVKAVVVLRAEAKGKTSAEDIIAWARENMAAYKVPKIVQFVDVLPKSGSGKVMWRLLQDQEAER